VRVDDGEVLISAPWCSSGYDRLADTERRARSVDDDGRIWHRSGDLGHLDDAGRLWIEGRVVHAVHTAVGIVTPVPIELAVETCGLVTRAAAVGVGPAGVQQLVVIVESPRRRSLRLAPLDVVTEVRASVAERVPDAPPVAAVLEVGPFPVDVRHNSKIDRTLLAEGAAALLSGRG
jgi:long-subunit acyl-CoA synthetase (AMP-forming)